MKTEDRSRVLLFEPDGRGHPFEWIMHLHDFVADSASWLDIVVVGSAALTRQIANESPPKKLDRFSLVTLTAHEFSLCTSRHLSISAMSRWFLAQRYARRVSATAVLFLEMDHLSLPLALQLPFAGLDIIGILFRPSVHYGELDSPRPTRHERIRDARKHILYPLMLRHRNLSAVLSLDPFFPAYTRQHYAGGEKVTAIPDPICRTSGDHSRSGVPWDLPQGRTMFLLFGVLTERKGILKLLDALPYLSVEAARRTAILIAGRVDESIKQQVDFRIERVRRRQPDLIIRLIDRYMEPAALEALVSRSDVVLAPYQRFVGSSGILVWAARLGLPVISQDYGLIGALVRRYRLGVAVDTSKPDRLAGALEQAVKAGPNTLGDQRGMMDFVRDKEPERFSAAVIEHIPRQYGGVTSVTGPVPPRYAPQ